MKNINHSWAILSAACLFNKTKVTLEEVAKEWLNGTIVVCEKPNGSIGFIAGSQANYGVIGQSYDCHDDQTFAKKGSWKIIDEINYSTDNDKVTHFNLKSNFDKAKKATIHVFK
jgi:hypothetical protein